VDSPGLNSAEKSPGLGSGLALAFTSLVRSPRATHRKKGNSQLSQARCCQTAQ
jgi:hypothetical protein